MKMMTLLYIQGRNHLVITVILLKFRSRINNSTESTLSDGDRVLVILKDRSKNHVSEEEQEWYDRAFGKR